MLSKIHSIKTNGVLSVVQFQTNQINSFEYLSGPQSIEKSIIEVREVNDSGSVNNLIVLNSSEYFIFFSDGDILAGAKQNRVLNSSVLLAPHSKTSIPVSCVEQGRWHHISPNFKTTDYSAPVRLRASKSESVNENLRCEMGFAAEQGMVWNEVSDYHSRHNISSNTKNLSDMYDIKKNDFDSFINSFSSVSEANGIAVFVNKNLLLIEAFNRTAIFNEYFKKILRGVAAEAFYLKSENTTMPDTELRFKIESHFDEIEKLPKQVYRSVGVGIDQRFSSQTNTGSTLEYQDHLIHFTSLQIVNK